MKKLIFLLFCIVTGVSAEAQTVIGKWKTIDDETGKAKSVVEIYESNGKVYGKIVEILDKTKEKNLCEKCSGSKKNQPLKGLVILEGLTKDDDEWSGGKILDPTTGKTYKCTVSLENADKLKVRGYIGISLMGRTQYWQRMK